MIWLCSALALAGRWDDAPTDVEVTRTLDASPEAISAVIHDLASWPGLLPGDCAIDWALNASTRGVGTRARVRYVIGPMRRPLALVITRDEPGVIFELEHEGDRGWFTQVRYAPATDTAGATAVTLSTPLSQPPWPLRGMFHRRVRPAWERCYQQALERLADQVVPR